MLWLNLHGAVGDFTIAHQPSFREDFHDILARELLLVLGEMKYEETPFIPQMISSYIFNVVKNTKTGSCDAGNYIVMRPNGDIFPCTILSQIGNEFRIGNINDKYLDLEKIDLLRNAATSSCKSCQFHSLCDGGCRYERIYNFREEWGSNICEHQCNIARTIHTVINSWYKSLTTDQRNRIDSKVLQIHGWKTEYSFGDYESAEKVRGGL
jgi:radical SAM protein with 4Fe4S-binding SPASM domain